MASNQDDDERQQRLAAIAELEHQHKLRRSVFTENEQVDPLSHRSGKYFVLLVSKGSGNLEQRANQDRAETILNEYPHEILDGSNFSLTSKRDELFAISEMRGNYPQLFLVDHGVTTFVGDFNIIDRRNDEGTLWALLAETQQKSSKKKKSIVTSVKSLLKSGSSTKKVAKDDIVGNNASSRTSATESVSTRSTSHLDSELPSSTIMESRELESGSPSASNRSAKKRHTLASSFGHLTKNHFLLEEEEDYDDMFAKPASTGQLIFSRSEGDIPLSEDPEIKSRRRHRSRSHGRSKDLKHSASKGHGSSISKEQNEKDESKDDEKPRSSAKSAKPRSRSKSKSEHQQKDEEHKNGELGDTATKPRKHRSTSRGRIPDSFKSSRHDEEHYRRKSSRSRSQGRLRDSAKGCKDGERSNSSITNSEENGEMNLKEEGSPKTSTRSKSLSKRNMRSFDSEGKEEGEVEEGDEIQAKPRKPRSRGSLTSNDGDDHVCSTDGTMKPKSRTRLREQDGEKHPTGRRRSGQSASPHKLRDKITVRSNSPGTYRGGIARKREAMKEFRERRSLKNIDPVDLSPVAGAKPRKHSSVGSINVTGLSPLNSPRRHHSLLNVQNEAKDLDDIDETLHELVKRVKDKEKKDRIDEETTEDEVQRPEPVMSSVQW